MHDKIERQGGEKAEVWGSLVEVELEAGEGHSIIARIGFFCGARSNGLKCV